MLDIAGYLFFRCTCSYMCVLLYITPDKAGSELGAAYWYRLEEAQAIRDSE